MKYVKLTKTTNIIDLIITKMSKTFIIALVLSGLIAQIYRHLQDEQKDKLRFFMIVGTSICFGILLRGLIDKLI